MSFLWDMWSIARSPVTGLLGTEEERQDKVTGLLIDKPFEFGKSIGLYGDKVEAPPVIAHDTNEPVTGLSLLENIIANTAQDAKVFGKNFPANMFEIGEFGVDLAMNPIKYAKDAFNLGSGFVTQTGAFPNIDNTSNEEMANLVVDSAHQFFTTEGALRKAALEHPADLLGIVFGGLWGIRKLENMSPERVAAITDQIRTIGATPVGLSMKNVGGDLVPRKSTDIQGQVERQLALVDKAGFYLKSEQTVLDMPQSSMPKEQVINYFKKRGLSQVELENLGLIDFIEQMAKGTQVTKQGLLDHIDANRVELYSSTLAGKGRGDDDVDRDYDSVQVTDPEFQWENTPYEERHMGAGGDDWNVIEDWDYAHEMGMEDIRSEVGSFQVRIGDTHGYNQEVMTAENSKYYLREHYPFNYGTEQYHMDRANTELIAKLHEMNPEAYPETTGMKLAKLDEELRARERSLANEANVHPEINALLEQGNLTPTRSTQMIRDEIDAIKKQLGERQRDLFGAQGNEPFLKKEWDEQMLEILQEDGIDYFDGDTVFPLMGGLTGSRIYSDIEDVASNIGADIYLSDPMFETQVIVGAEQYNVTGNSGMGWAIVRPDGSHLADGASDMPEVQSLILDDAMDQGYIDYPDEYLDEVDNPLGLDTGESRAIAGATKWEQYVTGGVDIHGNQAKGSNTYSEELIRMPDHEFEARAHFSGYKGLFGHYRKTLRADTEGEGYYHLEEMQSDFNQSRREFGATVVETADLIVANRQKYSEIDDLSQQFESGALTDAGRKSIPHMTIPEQMQTLRMMVSTPEKKAAIKQAFLVNQPDYLTVKALEGRKIVQPNMTVQEQLQWDQQYNMAKQGVKDWIEGWDTDLEAGYDNGSGATYLNPESENFSGWSDSQTDSVKAWLSQEGSKLSARYRKLQNHEHYKGSPMQGDERWIKNHLIHAIQKMLSDPQAVTFGEKGIRRISWTNSEQQLDVWNPSRRKDHNNKIVAKDLYEGLYDRDLPKVAKKMADFYGGNFGTTTFELNSGKIVKNFYLELTDEMINNMKMEHPDTSKAGFASSMYSKFPIPITAGLLATGEEDNRTGLLQ